MAWLAPRNTLRFLFRQRRHLWRSSKRLYVELRSGSTDDEGFLSSLERTVENLEGVTWARYVPVLERLVVELADVPAPDTRILNVVHRIELAYGYTRRPFAYGSRFPLANDPLYRAIAEVSGDVGGLLLGLLLQRGGNRQARFWVDVSAIATLIDNVPELRHSLENWLGHENADLLINLLSSFSEGMIRGWSGTLLDTLHRMHELGSFLQKRQSWSLLEEKMIQILLASRDVRGPASERPLPMPPGQIEKYQRIAEQMALAGFGVGMANTHDLTSAVAALFAAVPKPATLGRETFIVELERLLSIKGVFVVDREPLRLLDRINCLLVQSQWINRKRYVVSATQFYQIARKTPSFHPQGVLEGGDRQCRPLKRPCL